MIHPQKRTRDTNSDTWQNFSNLLHNLWETWKRTHHTNSKMNFSHIYIPCKTNKVGIRRTKQQILDVIRHEDHRYFLNPLVFLCEWKKIVRVNIVLIENITQNKKIKIRYEREEECNGRSYNKEYTLTQNKKENSIKMNTTDHLRTKENSIKMNTILSVYRVIVGVDQKKKKSYCR